MLGEGKKSGIINHSLFYDEFGKQSLGGLNWDVFGSLSALIICMVHIPFKSLLRVTNCVEFTILKGKSSIYSC